MKKKAIFFLLLCSIVFCSYSQTRRILIVSTNIDSVGNNVSGTYLTEIALPFRHFSDNGYEVDIVTPKGGKAAIYHTGKLSEELSSIQQNEKFIAKTGNSISPDKIRSKEYSAVYYPGGHGQYWDVITDERIARITAEIYENGGIVGTAGHGAASLINVTLSNCKYLVEGKTITCFPAWAEKEWMNISNYGKLLAFDMQEVLQRRGAKLIICTKETRDKKELTLVNDSANRIVTGSFASSAKWVAEEMLKLIKKQ
jgi:putative intracellular protease/amidase